jgi:hypothetical protein
MSLPYSYTSTFHFPEFEDFEKQLIIDNIKLQKPKNESLKKISIEKNRIEFVYHSLFGIEYPVEISLIEDPLKKIEYDIKLNMLILVCIVLVVFIAFFSSFGFNGFLWFSSIFTMIFYALNIFIIDKHVQNLLKLALNMHDSESLNEEILTKEQSDWIKDNSKCPACGEDITEYDKNCPECGLKLRENALQKPFDISKYKNKRIKYFYKDKKKR